MGWFMRERRGVGWKEQTLDSLSPPPLPLMVFVGLFIMMLYFATYSEFQEKMERSKMGFKFGMILLPVVAVAAVNMFMLYRRWWRNTFGPPSPPMYQAAAGDGSSPWGLLLVVGLLLVMAHYHSSFQSWFRSF